MNNNILAQIWTLAGFVLSLAIPNVSYALTEVLDGDQPVWIEPRTGMNFIELPGGCFAMGESKSEICVDQMSLGRFEVTNNEFSSFDATHDSGRFNGVSLNAPEAPVVNVSWNDAVDFAQWLSVETGLSFRLPTEAEWEYAAHGGTEDPWFWGVEAQTAYRFANLSGRDAQDRLIDGFDATAPIASFDPNPFGLFDMLGNASEWVADAYSGSPNRYGGITDNPVVLTGDGPLRVRRGGSFDQRIQQVSVIARDFYLESLGVPQTGFRLVMEMPE